MPCRITPSNLSGLIAIQLGNIEAEVRRRVENEVKKLIDKFLNQCPTGEELEKVIKTRNNLLSSIDKLEKRVDPFERLASKLEPPLNTAKKLVSVLKAIPILTTLGTPPGIFGGVIFSVPIGLTNKYSELLRLACELVVSIEDDIAAIKVISLDTKNVVFPIKERLNSLDLAIESCSTNSGLSEEQLKKIFEASRESNINERVDVPYRSVKGTDYKISVLQDPDSPSIAPRRFAVAKDRIGVIVLRGPKSFASSPDVLIEELKFRIDNQLP